MDHDLIVIGGGAAGLGAVRAALWAGADVALVTESAPGGDCTFTGCVPSKTLLAAARDGLSFTEAMARVRSTIELIAATESAEVLRSRGATVVEGRARLATHDTVVVGERRITAPRIVLATGSQPSLLDHIPRSGRGPAPHQRDRVRPDRGPRVSRHHRRRRHRLRAGPSLRLPRSGGDPVRVPAAAVAQRGARGGPPGQGGAAAAGRDRSPQLPCRAGRSRRRHRRGERRPVLGVVPPEARGGGGEAPGGGRPDTGHCGAGTRGDEVQAGRVDWPCAHRRAARDVGEGRVRGRRCRLLAGAPPVPVTKRASGSVQGQRRRVSLPAEDAAQHQGIPIDSPISSVSLFPTAAAYGHVDAVARCRRDGPDRGRQCAGQGPTGPVPGIDGAPSGVHRSGGGLGGSDPAACAAGQPGGLPAAVRGRPGHHRQPHRRLHRHRGRSPPPAAKRGRRPHPRRHHRGAPAPAR